MYNLADKILCLSSVAPGKSLKKLKYIIHAILDRFLHHQSTEYIVIQNMQTLKRTISINPVVDCAAAAAAAAATAAAGAAGQVPKRARFNTIFCNHPNDGLSDSEWNKIEARCYPGKCSESGFLKKGEKLRPVIDNDTMYLKSVGISCEQIADKLEEITNKYQELKKNDEKMKPIGARRDSLDQFYTVGNLKVSCVQYRGFQNCPFENESFESDKKCRGSRDYTITNTETNESIMFGDLLIHLIGHHHFFEGSVEYRIDPRKAISILGIQPIKK
jgi:hypothetical protein